MKSKKFFTEGVLQISVITTKIAYDELEREGYINTVAGKGCYVAEKNTEIIREGNLRQIEDRMREILNLAKGGNLDSEDLVMMFRTICEEG